jgi:hypothetical protein
MGEPRDGDFYLPVNHQNERIEGRRVFTEAFVCIKGESGHSPGRLLDQGAADDGTGLVLDQIGLRDDAD